MESLTMLHGLFTVTTESWRRTVAGPTMPAIYDKCLYIFFSEQNNAGTKRETPTQESTRDKLRVRLPLSFREVTMFK